MAEDASPGGRQSTGAEIGMESLRAGGGVRRSVVEHDAHESNEHVAFLYETQEEQFATVVPFVHRGLERGEKCIYVVDDNEQRELVAAMRREGVAVEDAREAGALIFLTRETYVGGSFDPDERLAALAEAIDAARDSYPAVRVAVEMTCFLEDALSYRELVAYEERYNEVSEDVEATALCQYNRDRFPAEVLRDVIHAHPHLVADGTFGHNVYYTPPEEFFDPTSSAREVDRMTDTLTRLAETETELKRQNERLEEFVSFVSHDLRNPLNVAEGHFELAREEHESEHLDAVGDAHERMRSLIEDFLALAREGEPVNASEPIHLGDLARECWAARPAEDATLAVDTDRTVRGDPGRTRQLLENLLGNAIEHGSEDGTVTVGDLPDGFYVADDGPGIPPGERHRVFESGYSTTDDGTGFGLSIVAAIVDAHGWSIDVTESEASGTRFEITGVETLS